MTTRLVRLTVLNPRNLEDEVLSEAEILDWFAACDAGWMYQYPADSARAHAKLTSGKCSDGFFDCQRVLQHPNLAEILGLQLAKKLLKAIEEKVEYIIGSPYAAIVFSHEVAKGLLYTSHGFCEKDPADPTGEKFIWRRIMLPKGTYILQVEELITTSKTTLKVRRAVREGNSEEVVFLPIVGALVHRPPQLPVQYEEGIQVVALVEKKVQAWEPQDCPLCQAGSKPVRPKTHWAELTGQA